ncbi:MAG: phenylalanine--tRNA ligase subunit beta [Phycisphaerae bacterium]|jgi:phenylalanyl-tRNA synthetase beta chain
MLISLNWIRDYTDLPTDVDARDLAERFTLTTAEVDSIERVKVDARGVIAAKVLQLAELPRTHNLRAATLDLGGGRSVTTVTAAPALHVGSNVVYAPPGARVAAYGEVGSAEVAGRKSAGMILPGDAIGIPMAAQEAIFLCDEFAPGDEPPPELFEDWVIEVDNKSITHRPDLWGHYGIAREIAAILGLPLKPYPVVPIDELTPNGLPSVEIQIADGNACPRYSGLVVEGVPTQPAPLWMQLRLGHIGMRPISGLVDLTNYIMADLGQPMHAFDAAKVGQIEVDWADDGENFRTLDGMERTLTADTLMIKRKGQSVALAGVMGGLESEVAESTVSLLLESANFEPATIRRAATRLGLRTDASARFEKALDPAHTVLAIQRFIRLARPMYPELKLTARLSDAYPNPLQPVTVRVNPEHVHRMIGREVGAEEIRAKLEPLEFSVEQDGASLMVNVPSFRATTDVTIEADVIEEIARCIGYNTIVPTMPRVSIRRFEPNALRELEQRTLEFFVSEHGFCELHDYIWYDSAWLDQLGVDPGRCVELANPAGEGLHRLRTWLMPGLLEAVAVNRFHFPTLTLIETGSVFEPAKAGDLEWRHLGLISARRGKRKEDEVFARLKGAIDAWSWARFAQRAAFAHVDADPQRPWEHPQRTAAVVLDGKPVGRVSVVDLALRQKVDEHLSSWAVAWAEIRLTGLEEIEHRAEPLGAIPEHPLVNLDFSIEVPRTSRYREIADKVGSFKHDLLKRVEYVGSYEGERIAADRRSLTFRTIIGDDRRTLVDDDANTFTEQFEQHLKQCGYEIRR